MHRMGEGRGSHAAAISRNAVPYTFETRKRNCRVPEAERRDPRYCNKTVLAWPRVVGRVYNHNHNHNHNPKGELCGMGVLSWTWHGTSSASEPMSIMRTLSTILLASGAGALNVAPRPSMHSPQVRTSPQVRASAQPAYTTSEEQLMRLQRAAVGTWQRYVLIRPGMTFQELKARTQLLNDGASFKVPNLDARAPGTFRTIFLTHLICFPAAIPALLSNPQVLPKLIEIASLSRLGIETDVVATLLM